MALYVDDLGRLQRTMRRAGRDLGEFKRLHGEVGRIVATAGKGRAPVATGRLKATVKAGRASQRQATVRAGTTARGAAPYAGPIHWGWPARSIAAQPFLSEAATGTEPAWLTNYMRHIDRCLAEVKGL